MLRFFFRAALAAGLVLLPVEATTFSGGGIPDPPIFDNVAGFFTWDLSRLSLIDTTNGMKLTGSISGSYAGGLNGDFGGVVTLMWWRAISEPAGTQLTQLSHLTSATSAHSSNISLYGLRTYSRVGTLPFESSLSCFGTGSGPVTSGADLGPNISAALETASCVTASNPAYLELRLDIQFIYSGPAAASISVDLGNSAVSEAQLSAASVPEPAAAALTAAGLMALRWLRSRSLRMRAVTGLAS